MRKPSKISHNIKKGVIRKNGITKKYSAKYEGIQKPKTRTSPSDNLARTRLYHQKLNESSILKNKMVESGKISSRFASTCKSDGWIKGDTTRKGFVDISDIQAMIDTMNNYSDESSPKGNRNYNLGKDDCSLWALKLYRQQHSNEINVTDLNEMLKIVSVFQKIGCKNPYKEMYYCNQEYAPDCRQSPQFMQEFAEWNIKDRLDELFWIKSDETACHSEPNVQNETRDSRTSNMSGCLNYGIPPFLNQSNDWAINKDWGCYFQDGAVNYCVSDCAGGASNNTDCCINSYPEGGHQGPDWYNEYFNNYYNAGIGQIVEEVEAHAYINLYITYKNGDQILTEPTLYPTHHHINATTSILWSGDYDRSFCDGASGTYLNAKDCILNGYNWISNSPYDIPVISVHGQHGQSSDQLNEYGCFPDGSNYGDCSDIRAISPIFKHNIDDNTDGGVWITDYTNMTPPLWSQHHHGSQTNIDYLIDDGISQYPYVLQNGVTGYHIKIDIQTDESEPLIFKMWDPVGQQYHTVGCWSNAMFGSNWQGGTSANPIELQVQIDLSGDLSNYIQEGCMDPGACNFDGCANTPCDNCCTQNYIDSDGMLCAECESEDVRLKYWEDCDGDGRPCINDIDDPVIMLCPESNSYYSCINPDTEEEIPYMLDGVCSHNENVKCDSTNAFSDEDCQANCDLNDCGEINVECVQIEFESGDACDCPGAIDECGVCDGDNISMDCNGECYGNSLIDACGLCQDYGGDIPGGGSSSAIWCYIDNDGDGLGTGLIDDGVGQWCCDNGVGHSNTGCSLNGDGTCPSGYSLVGGDVNDNCGSPEGGAYDVDDCENCVYPGYIENCMKGDDGTCVGSIYDIILMDECGQERYARCSNVGVAAPFTQGQNPCEGRCGVGTFEGFYPTIVDTDQYHWNDSCLDCSGEVLGGKEYDMSGVLSLEHCCTNQTCTSTNPSEPGGSDCRMVGCPICQTESTLQALRDNRYFSDTDGDTLGAGIYDSWILGLEGYCGESNNPCPVGHQHSGQNMCYGWIDNE